jgi:hypothetical protein
MISTFSRYFAHSSNYFRVLIAYHLNEFGANSDFIFLVEYARVSFNQRHQISLVHTIGLSVAVEQLIYIYSAFDVLYHQKWC